MSQGGRGRGRGRGAFQPETKRPGGVNPEGGTSPKGGDSPSLPGGASVDELVSSLNTLSINTKDVSQVSDTIMKLAGSMDKKDLAKLVYQRALDEWRMSRTISLLCQQIIEDPKDGHNFRSSLLCMLQNDYNKRDDLRNSNKTQYLGCLAFLCQVYTNLRNENGENFSVLLDPVFKAEETLLDNKAEEEEMLCATYQLFTCGKMMQLSDPTRWRNVIQAVRDIILDNRGSRDLRAACIDLVEVAASEWKMSVPPQYL